MADHLTETLSEVEGTLYTDASSHCFKTLMSLDFRTAAVESCREKDELNCSSCIKWHVYILTHIHQDEAVIVIVIVTFSAQCTHHA